MRWKVDDRQRMKTKIIWSMLVSEVHMCCWHAVQCNSILNSPSNFGRWKWKIFHLIMHFKSSPRVLFIKRHHSTAWHGCPKSIKLFMNSNKILRCFLLPRITKISTYIISIPGHLFWLERNFCSENIHQSLDRNMKAETGPKSFCLVKYFRN